MSELSKPTAQDLDMALANARQTITLLRSQAQANFVDPVYFDERLAALEKVFEQVTASHRDSVQQRSVGVLYEVSRVIGSSLELQIVLDQVMDAIIQLTGAERGFLMLLDDDGKLVVRVARNFDQETLEGGEFAVSRTITRQVVNSGEPVVTTNAQTDPRYSGQASIIAHALRSIMATPLRARGHIIGVVYVDNRIRTGLFSEKDLEVLDAFAAQAAVAIDNARLYSAKDQALADRVEELTMLQWIDRQLNETLDMTHAMQITLEWSSRLCEAESASLGLYDKEADALRWVAHFGEPDEFSASAEVALTHPLIGQVFETKEAALQFSPPGVEPPRTILCVPIHLENNVIGVLTLAAPRANAFDEDAQALVSRLADRAAIAIENGRLYDAVQAANKAKSEFVSLVAHELKVPMTSISGYADLLGMAGSLTGQQQGFVGTIKSNVKRMAVLVSDLNDISRIESGQLYIEPEPVNVRAAIAEAKDGVMQQITDRGHSLVENISDTLPAVWADHSRVVQVLVNLLSNAYKYTPDGGTITVDVKPVDQCVCISVTDTGVGMTPEQIAQLGTKFWRADNEHVIGQPGTGLGLAITRNLLTLMGGDLGVQSTPGTGSTFTLTLPVRDGGDCDPCS
ncbi:MAG: GAF domain-containing sensor histidine kinase [Anaerolineae bacterium]|nr:GAF domain-containing sensor histidine kinase [Anaerolineae bacterium]